MQTVDKLPAAKIKYITFGAYIPTYAFLRENNVRKSIHNKKKFWQIYLFYTLFTEDPVTYFGVWQMASIVSLNI